MSNTNLPNSNAPTTCSRDEVERLGAMLEGYEAELYGQQSSGHPRSTLGRSFGRQKSEIVADIDRIQEQLVQCNNQES